MLYLFSYIITGLFAGMIGGLLGFGGASIIVPALVLIFHLPLHMVIGIALMIDAVVAGSGSHYYMKTGLIMKQVVVVLTISAVCGIIFGSILGNIISGANLKKAFGIWMFFVAIDTIFRKEVKEKKDLSKDVIKSYNKFRICFTGFFMGTLSGILGIGGGTVATPLQRSLLKIPFKNAIANSLFTIMLSTSLGAIIYMGIGGVIKDSFPLSKALITGLIIAPGAVIGAQLGARINKRISVKYIQWMFVAVAFYIAFKMIF